MEDTVKIDSVIRPLCIFSGRGMNTETVRGIHGMTFRSAEETDSALIPDFICRLAAYEKMPEQVVAAEALPKKPGFLRQSSKELTYG